MDLLNDLKAGGYKVVFMKPRFPVTTIASRQAVPQDDEGTDERRRRPSDLKRRAHDRREFRPRGAWAPDGQTGPCTWFCAAFPKCFWPAATASNASVSARTRWATSSTLAGMRAPACVCKAREIMIPSMASCLAACVSSSSSVNCSFCDVLLNARGAARLVTEGGLSARGLVLMVRAERTRGRLRCPRCLTRETGGETPPCIGAEILQEGEGEQHEHGVLPGWRSTAWQRR